MASRSAACAASLEICLSEPETAAGLVPFATGFSAPFDRSPSRELLLRSGSPSTIMRLIMFSSSRTLPGKLCWVRRSIVSGGSVKPSRWNIFA